VGSSGAGRRFRALRRALPLIARNSDAPLVHALYADFRIERVAARRAINSKAGRRGPVYEVVVLSY